ncbi:MAG: Fe-S cluster assembly protein SufB, partial [bacterium]
MPVEDKTALREELKSQVNTIAKDDYAYGFHDDDVKYSFKSRKGLDEEIVREISKLKKEPAWMLERRVQAYRTFMRYPMPSFLSTNALNEIDFSNIYYFMRASDKAEKSWEDVPEGVKRTFDRLGVPEAERNFLAGI